MLICRLHNFYSEKNDNFSFISKLINIKRNKYIQLNNNRDSVRDFIHVDDVCDIMEQFIMSPAPNGVYNIGTGKATSFEDIADAFINKYV